MKQFSVRTRARTQFVDVTGEVQAAAGALGLSEGVITVFVPHTTAGVTINENADPAVMKDMEVVLDRAIPWSGGYTHAEGNTAAHVKSSLMGSSVRVIVSGGRLQLGTWQSVYFCEFDGPRERTVWVSA